MAMAKSLFVAGYPGDVGGANTECWHTLKLWRQLGFDVTCLPTWPGDLGTEHLDRWQRRLEVIGVRTRRCAPETLGQVPGLPGATVVAFCNVRFLQAAERFRCLGCPVVWLGCMNWVFPGERMHYRRHGVFERYVFQSRFQRAELEPQLAKFGYRPEQGVLIRGALDCSEFRFQPKPHAAADAFVVGRLSRAAVDKFHPDTWRIYGRLPPPRRVRVLGWNREVETALGTPPAWADVLHAGAETAQRFLSTLHCLLPASGTAVENWPRAGLEAMAAGVPIVAERRGGWPEMIRHGETGFLADNDDELVEYAARLARDERLRLQMARAARCAVEQFSDTETLGAAWASLFESMQPAEKVTR
jgi:glycosyltransferase involved in cell wall biosynthesis